MALLTGFGELSRGRVIGPAVADLSGLVSDFAIWHETTATGFRPPAACTQ